MIACKEGRYYKKWCKDCRKANEEESDMQENPKEIQIDGATYRLVEPQKPEPKFEVGDFVRVRTGHHKVGGLYGKVVVAGSNYDCGIEFPQRIGGFHDAQGKTKNGHGWFVIFCDLEKVD